MQLRKRVVPFFLPWVKVQRDALVSNGVRAVQYRVKKLIDMIFFLNDSRFLFAQPCSSASCRMISASIALIVSVWVISSLPFYCLSWLRGPSTPPSQNHALRHKA